MSHPDYEIESLAIHLMEECAEVIQAIAKAERFGYTNSHPSTPQTNNMWKIRMEWDDACKAFSKLEKWYHEHLHAAN